jgi:hypothetical protein
MPSIPGAPILAFQDVEGFFIDLHWPKYLISAVAIGWRNSSIRQQDQYSNERQQL